MKKSVLQRKVRRWHRYLGLILGLQFLLWTAGGIYFSWSDMDEIHGDHQKAHIHPLSADIQLINPLSVIAKIKEKDSVNFIFDLKLIQILSRPVYQIKYSAQHDRAAKVQLADAKTGLLRPSLNKSEAEEIAKRAFSTDTNIEWTEYLTATDSHHEYREQPLPAWAVRFSHPSKTTVYVAAELGTVQKFRNEKWRIFDFLWMLHTMDYQGRDNLSNLLLRLFSVFGLVTLLSGFVLFFLTRKKG